MLSTLPPPNLSYFPPTDTHDFTLSLATVWKFKGSIATCKIPYKVCWYTKIKKRKRNMAQVHCKTNNRQTNAESDSVMYNNTLPTNVVSSGTGHWVSIS